MNALLSVNDLNGNDVETLIHRALLFKTTKEYPKYNQTVVNLFYENSTRTKYSFLMAQRNLGLDILDFEIEKSSVSKGESLYDTLLTFKAIGVQLAVVRHPEDEFYNALTPLNMKMINAGAGCGEHPTQSLLDIMTIYEEYGSFKGLNVLIIGDLRHSRVAKSNAKILTKLGANLHFSSPDMYQDDVFKQFGDYVEVDRVIESMDVVMMLRIQNERHDECGDLLMYQKEYGMTVERYNKLKNDAIIMHPGPINRNVEIVDELVEAEKSRFVVQMENGVYMRMAILEALINESEIN
ncbi:aspartate carbamoyltransferase catalytic subunit [Erysipelothrix urinaevulpis]|uniref:aspartate carbamoyltransferase catalytic subunit n=1 Tax=Erysipelothrix urinaevulpis TaxID=2683717 RepID=UPI00135C391A|nr:aspartate carbamoyltransferase catalytic subunit [Erysipelothrix urinaevulpis]